MTLGKLSNNTRNFGCQLEQKIVEKHAIGAFGKVPRYRKIYYGEDDKGECVTEGVYRCYGSEGSMSNPFFL